MASKYSSRDSVNPDEPPKVPDIRMTFKPCCPYSKRILLVIDLKSRPNNIPDLKYIEVDPLQNLGRFLKKNDRNDIKVPYMIYDGKFLCESLLLADFLDDMYPKRPLWNCSPLQKILDKLVIQSFEKVETAVHKLFIETLDMEKENFEELIVCLIPFEAEIAERGSKYFGGEEPNMVDYMIWPWFEFLDAIDPYSNGKFVFPFDNKFPRLAEWKALMIVDVAMRSSPRNLALRIILMKNELLSRYPPGFNFDIY